MYSDRRSGHSHHLTVTVCNVGTHTAHSAQRHEHTDHCSTAHRDRLTVQISVSISSVFRTVLHSAVHSDIFHTPTTSVCIPVHHTHLAHNQTVLTAQKTVQSAVCSGLSCTVICTVISVTHLPHQCVFWFTTHI
jgi:hypothetical protein